MIGRLLCKLDIHTSHFYTPIGDDMYGPGQWYRCCRCFAIVSGSNRWGL